MQAMRPTRKRCADDPQIELAKAFDRVWQVMRHQLGTEALSEQTVKLVGAPPLPAEEV